MALVDGTVTVGAGSRVWQFASVLRGATIGRDCTVGGCAVVDMAVVGDRCLIGHGAQVHPGASIGDDVFVGPGAILCNDRWPRTYKNGFDIAKLCAGTVSVRVENWASIGAGAIVLPGVSVGKRVMVAAGAVVNQDIPSDHLLTRDGRLVPISEREERSRARMRMRAVG